MIKPFSSFILIFMLVLSGCGQQTKTSPSEHARVSLHWPGATAETIEIQIAEMAKHIDLVVIQDRSATLFYAGSSTELKNLISVYQAKLSEDVSFSKVISRPGAIPSAPAQRTDSRISFHLKNEQIKSLGLSFEAVSKELQELDLESLTKDSWQSLDPVMINLPSGQQVSLSSLVTIEDTPVTRPLVIKNSQP